MKLRTLSAKLLLIWTILCSCTAYAEFCTNVLEFKRNHRMVLNEILTKELGYQNIEGFLADPRLLDYQFNPMPNYFRSGRENNLHYRLILHFKNFSTTLIYDSVEREIVEKQMFSNW